MIQKLILFAGCAMLLTSLAGCAATSSADYSYDYSDPPYLYAPYWHNTHYGKRSNYHRHHQHHGQHHSHFHGGRSHPSHHRR